VQATSDAGGTIGDLGMIAPSLTAGDAEEERGCFGHCFFSTFVGLDASW
jgi:hypothetical protein